MLLAAGSVERWGMWGGLQTDFIDLGAHSESTLSG